MARAFPASDPQDFGHDAPNGDWQALRGELVALLDQVEGQYVRTAPQAPAFDALAKRMSDLRSQVGDAGAGNRHREALRMVKRQVDRLNERDEAAVLPEGTRDILQSAIQEIRARQQNAVPAEPARHAPAAHLDALTQAMSGVNSRIEQIEIELKQQRGTSLNVKEIADQVSQITHVVELLAGAVGETGQVKRLEGQIAGLAQLISDGQKVDLSHLTQRLDDVSETIERLSVVVSENGQISPLKNQIASLAEMVARGPQVDLSYLTRRLDEVSATVERLADLQIQQVQQLVRESKDAPKREQDLKDALGAIEAGVRNIYDRIDTIERTVALPPADLESLTEAMARFTTAMEANAGKPDALIPLVEALNARISDMDGKGSAVAGLKSDVAELRDTVLEAFEPRFAAIESRIEALGHRLKVEHHSDTGIAQLEAQVRQLVARMDQTGEQLSGLARLYTETEVDGEAPDFEALANLVATRTSEAFARNTPPAAPGITEEQLTSLEGRIARLFNEAGESRAPDDYNLVRDGIRRVDERLARLELSLTQGTRPVAAKPVERESAALPAPAPAADVADTTPDWAKSIVAARPPASTPVIKNDAMPTNPGIDAPLTDRGFPDLGTVRAALEAKTAQRTQHPGLAQSAEPTPYDDPSPVTAGMLGGATPRHAAEMPFEPPAFSPTSSVAPPPRPVSSFDNHAEDLFKPESAPPPAPARAEEVAPPAQTVNRNTFIEAARRSTQRQAATKTQPAGNSLIGRAMARFQNAGADAGKPAAAPVAAETPSKKLKDRLAKAPVEAPGAIEPLAPMEQDSISVEAEPARIELEPKESFLTRHRKPILLGATIVAVSVLTLNLVSQRLASSDGSHGSATTTPVPDTTSAPKPAPQSSIAPSSLPLRLDAPSDTATALPAAPRVIPMVDSTTTGSIDPSAAMNFTAPPETTPMPSILSPVSLSSKEFVRTTPAPGPQPAAAASPVQVEMPPEAVGPLLLRQSASNGDARAQFEVAAIYSEGRVVPEDQKTAAVWYERAAAQGFGPAQYRLGNLYESGKGVTKDLEQARLWYQRAAEAGNRMSMHNLAALYASGQLGKQEFASAAEWFEQAATRGMTDSQFNLGMLYARGLGVTQNLATSYKWFSLAAKRGDKDAAKARDDVARSLDAATVGKINGEVDSWKPSGINLAANFAPIGTWAKNFDPGQPIAAKDVVSKVQQALQRLGYDIGSPDGVAGAKTADAIKAFEQATGMSQVGKINPRLLAVLGSQPV
ncbi:MAG: PodJL [Hyphomicrobiales bacterium]|nr:PodJL [Hyphomicrobiales bacterium]